MEDLANEFSYAVIEDIGSAPCGLPYRFTEREDRSMKQSSPQHGFPYKTKLSLNPSESPRETMLESGGLPPSISKGQPKPSRHRYSTRSSSILLKSNSLALSDSESTLSEDTKGGSGNFFSERKQQRVKKSKRKKPEKDVAQLYPYIPISNSDQYFGKRKRSTTITQNSYEHSNSSQLSSYTANRLKKSESSAMQCDSFNKTGGKLTKFVVQNENEMDLDGEQEEDSTSLSEESNLSDPKFEADDEQSDYYEVSSSLQKKNRARYGRTSLDKPSFANPFSMLSSTSPSTSSSIWKRRRRNNLPGNHFN